MSFDHTDSSAVGLAFVCHLPDWEKIHALRWTPRRLQCAELQRKQFCAGIFEQLTPNFLNDLRQNFEAYLCQILTFSISEHIYMLICAINTIFLWSPTYTVSKDTAPGISASAVYWSRFDGGCRQNDQLPALVCLGKHAFGFRAIA